MPQQAPAQEIKPGLSARGGPAGAEVTITMTGLLPFQPVRVGFGSLSAYEVLGRAESNAKGVFESRFKVPSWAELDRPHYFVVTVGNGRRVLSEPFHVTDVDGTARLTGPITTEPTGCLTLIGRDKVLYALQGEAGRWDTGQQVMVVGSIAERNECAGGGLPIAVREIHAL